jgi:hypothetical protein
MDELHTLLEELQTLFTINPNQIYLAGFIEGANGVWELGLAHPELFAALTPVGGYIPSLSLKIYATSKTCQSGLSTVKRIRLCLPTLNKCLSMPSDPVAIKPSSSPFYPTPLIISFSPSLQIRTCIPGC